MPETEKPVALKERLAARNALTLKAFRAAYENHRRRDTAEMEDRRKMTDTQAPRLRMNAERRAERIAELMKERGWHFDEIESAQRAIDNHYRNVRDIEDQIAALKNEAA